MAMDEGAQVKEVFAYFGRAYYQAGVLEAGLAIALMRSDFLDHIRIQYLENPGSFDRAHYEVEFDRFMENQHAQTLGNLIKRASALTEISENLKQRLREAKKRWDFLGHHYFRERASEFSSIAGRDRMVMELRVDADMFEAVDEELYSELAPIREKLGMGSEKFREYLTQFYLKHGVAFSQE